VGVHDISRDSLERARKDYALDGIPTFLEFQEGLEKTSCDAVLIAPIAEAHADAALAGIDAGCHLLIEKPMVTVLSDGFRIARAAREKGVIVGVVQNWRTKSVGLALRQAITSKRIGTVGNIFFRYVRDREQAHLPSYLFNEPFPLLYAMAIHHFDLFRYVLNENIVTVQGEAFTPSWSRYQSPSGVHLWMKTESGIPISYVGSFSSKNKHIAQESLVIDGALGSLTNDSQWGEPPLLFSGVNTGRVVDLTEGESRDVREQYNQADDKYLEDFRDAIQTGRAPLCTPEDNLWTLATVDAAVRACKTGSPVDITVLLKEISASMGQSS
jgi:predicted dehydrogenase